MVETTPVVWKGRLLRFESVRGNYGSEPGCPTCGLQQRDPAMKGQVGGAPPASHSRGISGTVGGSAKSLTGHACICGQTWLASIGRPLALSGQLCPVKFSAFGRSRHSSRSLFP